MAQTERRHEEWSSSGIERSPAHHASEPETMRELHASAARRRARRCTSVNVTRLRKLGRTPEHTTRTCYKTVETGLRQDTKTPSIEASPQI